MYIYVGVIIQAHNDGTMKRGGGCWEVNETFSKERESEIQNWGVGVRAKANL